MEKLVQETKMRKVKLRGDIQKLSSESRNSMENMAAVSQHPRSCLSAMNFTELFPVQGRFLGAGNKMQTSR